MKFRASIDNLGKVIFGFIAAFLSVVFLSGMMSVGAQTIGDTATIPAIQNVLAPATNNQDKATPNAPSMDVQVPTQDAAVNLTNSTVQLDPVIFKDPATQNNFYPGKTINMMALIEAQGTGQDYINGHVKIYLSKDIFQKVNDNDISSSQFLAEPASVTETTTDWVVNLKLNKVPSGAHIGIPFLATLKPGKIQNNKDYKVPSEYYDSKDTLLFKTDKFSIHTQTDAPSTNGPGVTQNLDTSNWDSSDALKAAKDISVNGNGFYSNLPSINYTNHTEPGDYTVTVNVPAGYKVPANGAGNWTYDETKNTLTQKITLSTTNASSSNSYWSLGSFTLTVPKGYKAGTTVNLPTTTVGPNGDVSSTSHYLQLSKTRVDPPQPDYFYPNGSKSISFEGIGWSTDVNKISAATPVVSTFNPAASYSYRGDTPSSMALSSVTDTPRFDYPTNEIAFVDSSTLTAGKQGELNKNKVVGTYMDGTTSKTEDLGTVTFGTPLKYTERQYTSIKVTFDKAVDLSLSELRTVQFKLTGHMTEDTINAFKKGTSTYNYYYNYMSAEFVKTDLSSYQGSSSGSDYLGLNQDRPTIGYNGYPGLELSGQNYQDGKVQMLGGKPLLASMTVRVYNNGLDKLEPKDGKVIFIVPDGVSYDSDDATEVQNLTNIKVVQNYAGSGKTAVIGDITNPTSFASSNTAIKYRVPLIDDGSMISGSYNIQSFFVFTNNNGKPGNMTDFQVEPSAKRVNDTYGIYSSTNNKDNIISDTKDFTYLPDRKLVNVNKVKVFDPEANVWSQPVKDTGDSAFIGDKLEYVGTMSNDGLSPYTYLDVIGILPHPGDQKINGARGSNVQMHLTGPIQLDTDGYTVSYSTAKPDNDLLKNYEAKFDATETDWSKVTMIRISSKDGTVLNTEQSIHFTYPSLVPNVAKDDAIANKAQGISTFIVRTSDHDVNLLESTPASVLAKQPYVPVNLQFWTKDQDGTEHQIADAKSFADQKIGSTFTKNAADFPILHYSPADSQDHSVKVSRVANNNVLKLWYKANPDDATVKGVVKFQDLSGKTLEKDIPFSGISGYRYDITTMDSVKQATKKILGEGYKLSSTEGQPTGIFAVGKPVTVIYKFDKPTPPIPPTPPTPPTPKPDPKPTPNPDPTPTPNPTPTPTPQPTPGPDEPDYVAKKNEAVYALKKVYLYQKPTFNKSQRKAGYVSKPRVYRPMFVVTGYARSANGALRYKVRDVNHLTKNRHKTGYVTARWSHIRPVYYQSKHTTLTVINPRGVNEYKNVNLTGKVQNFKQGKVLKVKKFVHHNLTTRYLLTNGHYITGNRKLVKMGKAHFPKYVKAKKAVNLYKTVNLTHKNKHYKKGLVFKVYKVDFSHANSVTKHGAMRYQVAGGYITANAKFMKTVK
ncbi:hypothetical protein LASUN_05600 [Lentilactobacillus sunkii]|uniref:DUF5776 domain-containing protein n=1 Tax=Lentilactobacillus sunkii TaxID=481719 RepID=A0A1E7XH29_9LACO|nr:DUF5776 domain-containing protein [Lentilactobacillus sunkii]OFA12338.1 hypothetical protein LASUN_05600 [Lentilactobacillus sunkii]